jgi:hypothetical protein
MNGRPTKLKRRLCQLNGHGSGNTSHIATLIVSVVNIEVLQHLLVELKVRTTSVLESMYVQTQPRFRAMDPLCLGYRSTVHPCSVEVGRHEMDQSTSSL